MRRVAAPLRITLLLLSSLAVASSCGSSGSGDQGGGGGGGGDEAGAIGADGSVDTSAPDGGGGIPGGPVSVLPGSLVTVSDRAADGSVSGTYSDPRTQQRFAFSVRATGATSAVASYTLDTLGVHVTVSGPSAAALTMTESDTDLGTSITGNGPLPADPAAQLLMSMLGQLFAPAIRAIPLELDCGKGFTPVEIAALLVPWQVVYKYQLTPATRYGDVQAAAGAATCSAFEFARASSTQPAAPITKPSGAGLINLGNDDPTPSVLGFFALDRAGANDGATFHGFGIDTAYGTCNSMCRGACGADCESNNCKSATGLSQCEKDAQGANTCYKLVYTDYVCGTHAGCVAHDACYDKCNEDFGCGTFIASYCMHAVGHPEGYTSCDQHVIDEYGASQGFEWARGFGPYTGSQTYRYVSSREYDATACPCVHECVPAGTLVAAADGRNVPIERVDVGEEVATVEPFGDGDSATARVEQLLVHRDGPYTLDRLESASGTELLVTPNHPVWTVELGWVPAEDLVVGAHMITLDSSTGRAQPEGLVSIVRAFSKTDVVYNLKTSRSSYVAAGVLVHNKCLARGSLVDTPAGAVPIEALRPGDRVDGQVDGRRVATRVLRTYEKTTILGRLPGRRLAPRLLVTDNHAVITAEGDDQASSLPAPTEDALGVVYDLETESGNYWAQGLLLRAASTSAKAALNQ